jgi:hypothetical protein
MRFRGKEGVLQDTSNSIHHGCMHPSIVSVPLVLSQGLGLDGSLWQHHPKLVTADDRIKFRCHAKTAAVSKIVREELEKVHKPLYPVLATMACYYNHRTPLNRSSFGTDFLPLAYFTRSSTLGSAIPSSVPL